MTAPRVFGRLLSVLIDLPPGIRIVVSFHIPRPPGLKPQLFIHIKHVEAAFNNYRASIFGLGPLHAEDIPMPIMSS